MHAGAGYRKMRRAGVWRGRKGGMFERDANERILRAAMVPPLPHLANISTHECSTLCLADDARLAAHNRIAHASDHARCDSFCS